MSKFEAVTPAGAYAMAMAMTFASPKPSEAELKGIHWSLAGHYDRLGDAARERGDYALAQRFAGAALNAANRASRA